MRVADTSALYAVFVAGDAHHEAAREHIADPDPILVPAEVLGETLSLLHFRHGHAFARACGKALRALPHLEVQPTPDDPWDDLLARTWETFGATPRLSYVDCVVVAWCLRRGLDPWTYDKDLRRIAQRPPA